MSEWLQVANSLNSQTGITSLAVFENRLYGGTSPNGRLFNLNNVGNAWEQVCAQLTETGILSLCEFNNNLYGGTTPNGRLFRAELDSFCGFSQSMRSSINGLCR